MPRTKQEKFKLPKKVKAKWIKALRSGKYLQGRSYLVKEDIVTGKQSYCCLGVACDLGLCKPLNSSCNTHVEEVFIPMETQTDLAVMNDGSLDKRIRRKSFIQIANWIQKNL
jgi:hypothetical protein